MLPLCLDSPEKIVELFFATNSSTKTPKYKYKMEGILYFHFPKEEAIAVQFSRYDKLRDLKSRIDIDKDVLNSYIYVTNSGFFTDEMTVSTAKLGKFDHVIAVKKKKVGGSRSLTARKASSGVRNRVESSRSPVSNRGKSVEHL